VRARGPRAGSDSPAPLRAAVKHVRRPADQPAADARPVGRTTVQHTMMGATLSDTISRGDLNQLQSDVSLGLQAPMHRETLHRLAKMLNQPAKQGAASQALCRLVNVFDGIVTCPRQLRNVLRSPAVAAAAASAFMIARRLQKQQQWRCARQRSTSASSGNGIQQAEALEAAALWALGNAICSSNPHSHHPTREECVLEACKAAPGLVTTLLCAAQQPPGSPSGPPPSPIHQGISIFALVEALYTGGDSFQTDQIGAELGEQVDLLVDLLIGAWAASPASALCTPSDCKCCDAFEHASADHLVCILGRLIDRGADVQPPPPVFAALLATPEPLLCLVAYLRVHLAPDLQAVHAVRCTQLAHAAVEALIYHSSHQAAETICNAAGGAAVRHLLQWAAKCGKADLKLAAAARGGDGCETAGAGALPLGSVHSQVEGVARFTAQTLSNMALLAPEALLSRVLPIPGVAAWVCSMLRAAHLADGGGSVSAALAASDIIGAAAALVAVPAPSSPKKKPGASPSSPTAPPASPGSRPRSLRAAAAAFLDTADPLGAPQRLHAMLREMGALVQPGGFDVLALMVLSKDHPAALRRSALESLLLLAYRPGRRAAAAPASGASGPFAIAIAGAARISGSPQQLAAAAWPAALWCDAALQCDTIPDDVQSAWLCPWAALSDAVELCAPACLPDLASCDQLLSALALVACEEGCPAAKDALRILDLLGEWAASAPRIATARDDNGWAIRRELKVQPSACLMEGL